MPRSKPKEPAFASVGEIHVNAFREVFRRGLRFALEESSAPLEAVISIEVLVRKAEKYALKYYQDSRGPILDLLEQGGRAT